LADQKVGVHVLFLLSKKSRERKREVERERGREGGRRYREKLERKRRIVRMGNGFRDSDSEREKRTKGRV
jgi:hypothetical protein